MSTTTEQKPFLIEYKFSASQSCEIGMGEDVKQSWGVGVGAGGMAPSGSPEATAASWRGPGHWQEAEPGIWVGLE